MGTLGTGWGLGCYEVFSFLLSPPHAARDGWAANLDVPLEPCSRGENPTVSNDKAYDELGRRNRGFCLSFSGTSF